MSRHAACISHRWRVLRNGVEQCETCKTRYPCKSKCTHVDCADQRDKLSQRKAIS